MKTQRLHYGLVIMVIFLSTSDSTTAAPCPTPAREGSLYILSHAIVVGSDKQEFTWSFENQFNRTLAVVKCSVASCEWFRLKDQHRSAIEKIGNQYKSTFIVKNVSRDMDGRRWILSDGSSNVEDCSLEVYSFDSIPVCGDIQITSQGSTSKPFVVSWTCSVSNVYPSPLCQFEYKMYNEKYQTVSSNHIKKDTVTSSGNPVYYSRSCTMNVPVSTLQPGTYSFKVTMYPDVTGTSPSIGTWLESDDVTLSLPVASIKDCPIGSDVKDGYIKKGSSATCQCYLTDVGNPPGRPQWVTSNGIQTGQSLTVSYIAGDGPSHVTIYINENVPTFNFCESTTTFQAYCDMTSDSVNPKPTVRLEGTDANTIRLAKVNEPRNTYRYQFTVNPKTGGILTLKCVATNSIFPDLTTQDEGTITIQAPPTSSPVMSVDNGDSIDNSDVTTVISGQRHVVKCHVDGGYPAVSKVTTTCVGSQNVANGVEATQTLDVDRDMNEGKCSCMAEHVTGCYHKTTEFTLNVQYIPTVTEYTANSQSQTLVVEDRDSVTLSCKAEGNPRPNLSIIGQRSMVSLTLQDTDSGDYIKTSDVTKTMRCKDTDTYICMSDNRVGDGMEKNVSVFVRCTPELPSRGVKPEQEFEMTNATDLEIFIDIIGYPKPTGYTLTKVKSGRGERRAVTGVVVDKRRYNVTYLPKEPPEGTVMLKMVGLQNAQYGLTIRNGVGEMDFMFNVTIVPECVPYDDESNMGTAAGVAVGCCLLLSIGTFILGMQVGKRRKCRNKKPPKMLQPSPDYDDCNVPPLQEAYVDLDSIQLQEARQHRQQQQQKQQQKIDGYEIPRVREPQQQRDGDYEIASHPGDNSNNPTHEYVGYETPRPPQDGDNTTNPTYEYVDIDGQDTVNSHSHNYTNITPTSKPSKYVNVSMN